MSKHGFTREPSSAVSVALSLLQDEIGIRSLCHPQRAGQQHLLRVHPHLQLGFLTRTSNKSSIRGPVWSRCPPAYPSVKARSRFREATRFEDPSGILQDYKLSVKYNTYCIEQMNKYLNMSIQKYTQSSWSSLRRARTLHYTNSSINTFLKGRQRLQRLPMTDGGREEPDRCIPRVNNER